MDKGALQCEQVIGYKQQSSISGLMAGSRGEQPNQPEPRIWCENIFTLGRVFPCRQGTMTPQTNGSAEKSCNSIHLKECGWHESSDREMRFFKKVPCLKDYLCTAARLSKCIVTIGLCITIVQISTVEDLPRSQGRLC